MNINLPRRYNLLWNLQVPCRFSLSLSCFSYTAFYTIQKYSVAFMLCVFREFFFKNTPFAFRSQLFVSFFFVSFFLPLCVCVVCVAIIWCNFIWDKIHILFCFTLFFISSTMCVHLHMCVYVDIWWFRFRFRFTSNGPWFPYFVTSRQYVVLCV